MIRTSGRGYEAATLAAGEAAGTALVLDEPLSFWGGFDAATGRITDRHHPQVGAILTGAVLVMPGGRGSSSSSSVLAEAIRAGTAPAAILLGEPDLIITLGALVASELYGRSVPIAVLPAHLYGTIADGEAILVDAVDERAAIVIDGGDEARS